MDILTEDGTWLQTEGSRLPSKSNSMVVRMGVRNRGTVGFGRVCFIPAPRSEITNVQLKVLV